MLLIGGKTLVPFVSAAIIQRLGWHWVFITVGIIVAVMFVLTFFCVSETFWDRTPSPVGRLDPEQVNPSKSSFQVSPQKLVRTPQSSENPAHQVTTSTSGEESGHRSRKKAYRELLAVYKGRLVREEWWKCAMKPFILFAYPAIAYVPLTVFYNG